MQTVVQYVVMDYQKRIRFIYSFIPKTNMENFPGEYGIKRVKLLLKKLGNPQEQVPVVHIAGTSGKGSTAIMTAKLLQAHGKKVGLHVKPHMYDLRERFQVNNTLISEKQFEAYADRFFSYTDAVNSAGYGKLTYFEILIALAYFIFAQEKVDYAVIETGVGGLYDGSNVVSNPNKLCVITSIGFDHTAILGNTLEKIAAQKAGIIQQQNTVIVLSQSKSINGVIEKRADSKQAQLFFIRQSENYTVEQDAANLTHVNFQFEDIKIKSIPLGLRGTYQGENAALALAAVSLLSKRDKFSLQEKAVRLALKTLSIPGRFDVQTVRGKQLVFDGAHNPQKMAAFLSNLKQYYPDKKFTFLLAFKEGKDIEQMITQITPLAKKIYITDFFNNQADFVSLSADLHILSAQITSHSFKNVEIIYNAADAIEDLLYNLKDDMLVVTGSLYLLSDIYKSVRRLRLAKV